MHSAVIAKESSGFVPIFRRGFSPVAFQDVVRGLAALAVEGGVRKKRASETYWKIDVLLLTNADL